MSSRNIRHFHFSIIAGYLKVNINELIKNVEFKQEDDHVSLSFLYKHNAILMSSQLFGQYTTLFPIFRQTDRSIFKTFQQIVLLLPLCQTTINNNLKHRNPTHSYRTLKTDGFKTLLNVWIGQYVF